MIILIVLKYHCGQCARKEKRTTCVREPGDKWDSSLMQKEWRQGGVEKAQKLFIRCESPHCLNLTMKRERLTPESSDAHVQFDFGFVYFVKLPT